jgi:hypothetical protein
MKMWTVVLIGEYPGDSECLAIYPETVCEWEAKQRVEAIMAEDYEERLSEYQFGWTSYRSTQHTYASDVDGAYSYVLELMEVEE